MDVFYVSGIDDVESVYSEDLETPTYDDEDLQGIDILRKYWVNILLKTIIRFNIESDNIRQNTDATDYADLTSFISRNSIHYYVFELLLKNYRDITKDQLELLLEYCKIFDYKEKTDHKAMKWEYDEYVELNKLFEVCRYNE